MRNHVFLWHCQLISVRKYFQSTKDGICPMISQIMIVDYIVSGFLSCTRTQLDYSNEQFKYYDVLSVVYIFHNIAPKRHSHITHGRIFIDLCDA